MIPTPRGSLYGDCPHCGRQPADCPDPTTCAICSCVACESRRQQTVERVQRARQRLIGQGSGGGQQWWADASRQARAEVRCSVLGGGPVILDDVQAMVAEGTREMLSVEPRQWMSLGGVPIVGLEPLGDGRLPAW